MIAPRLAALALACTLAPAAHATFHTWQIEQLYSNADGTVQYVVLHESEGANGESLLAGHVITATHAGVTHAFTFPADLPSAATAGHRLLLATRAFPVTSMGNGMTSPKLGYGYPPPPPPPPPTAQQAGPDYVLPDRFLFTDGATIDYAGVDSVTYAALPTDGATALMRDGSPAPAVATNFSGVAAALAAQPVTAVEYYDAAQDHYFMSPLAPDIEALDSGRIAGWARTGQSFKVQPAALAGVQPVCRFYIPPQHGDSHFFSASPAECAEVLSKAATDPNYSGFVEETDHAFWIGLPDTVTGACASGTVPVYRLFDNRADANHRYTTDPAIKATMVARGYTAEGYGPDTVIMCAPQ